MVQVCKLWRDELCYSVMVIKMSEWEKADRIPKWAYRTLVNNHVRNGHRYKGVVHDNNGIHSYMLDSDGQIYILDRNLNKNNKMVGFISKVGFAILVAWITAIII